MMHIDYFTAAHKHYTNQNELFEDTKKKLALDVSIATLDKDIRILQKKKLEIELQRLRDGLVDSLKNTAMNKT